jgi:tellurite resistance protein
MPPDLGGPREVEVVIVLVAVGLLAALARRRPERRTRIRATPSRQSTPAMRSVQVAPESSRPPSTPRRSMSSNRPRARWVPRGESVQVGDLMLPGGMLYFGYGMGSVGSDYGTEPALIDPTLFVDKLVRDDAGESMSYWPSYAAITPSARAAYLHWLANGRTDPSAYIGYVFLYFYGLERRALHDADHDPSAVRELPDIVAEVQRLLSIHRGSRSFTQYGGGFVDYLRVRHGLLDESADRPPEAGDGALPLALRASVARRAMAGEPIPSAWALAWVRSDPEAPLRTPATRCPEEFDRLFEARYRDQFGEGMRVKACKTTIRVTYRPASRSFGYGTFTCPTNLPDVCSLTTPRRSLHELASACCDELDGFSRLMGRDPEARGTPAAAALLPKPLLGDDESGVAKRLQELLMPGTIDGRTAILDSGALITAWTGNGTNKLGKKDSVLLAQLLQRLGFGVEPDVRFNGPAFDRASKAAVFRLAGGDPESPSPAYAAASLLLHLAVAVSAADGKLDHAEQAALERHVAGSLSLRPAEATRLTAHLEWLLASPPGLAGVKRRVRVLRADERRAVGQFLVQVALADGHVDPGEVRILSKIYTTLQLDPALVHSDVHALATTPSAPADQPVTMRPASPAPTGYRIPPPPSEPATTDRAAAPTGPAPLDMAAIEAKIEESAAVSALLAGIFVEDEPPPAAATEEKTVAGLDVPHGTLLRRLADKQEWPRADYEALAAELELLADGALETINEVAFEAHDEPVCEGDDPIRINPAVLEALLA